MATDIPPHNLREVVKGTIALIRNPQTSDEKLAEYIPAPDLPTKAEIITRQKNYSKSRPLVVVVTVCERYIPLRKMKS